MFRGQAVAGVVNDENARRLGGVAGHAGVFSTGMDVARFAQSWLKVTPLSSSWANGSTLLEFFQRTPQSGSRALGWDTKGDDKASSAGRYSHPEQFGVARRVAFCSASGLGVPKRGSLPCSSQSRSRLITPLGLPL